MPLSNNVLISLIILNNGQRSKRWMRCKSAGITSIVCMHWGLQIRLIVTSTFSRRISTLSLWQEASTFTTLNLGHVYVHFACQLIMIFYRLSDSREFLPPSLKEKAMSQGASFLYTNAGMYQFHSHLPWSQTSWIRSNHRSPSQDHYRIQILHHTVVPTVQHLRTVQHRSMELSQKSTATDTPLSFQVPLDLSLMIPGDLNLCRMDHHLLGNQWLIWRLNNMERLATMLHLSAKLKYRDSDWR